MELTSPLQSHADIRPGCYLHCYMLQHNYSPSTGAVPTSPPATPGVLALCPREQHPAAAAGRQAACRRVSDMAAACPHRQSAVQSVGLVNERCESISRGIAQPLPVLPEERRGRGGAGHIMTLPSLLTFIFPCNVLGCLTLFCN